MAGLLIVFCFSRYRIKELVHCASAHVIGSAGPMHVPTFFVVASPSAAQRLCSFDSVCTGLAPGCIEATCCFACRR